KMSQVKTIRSTSLRCNAVLRTTSLILRSPANDCECRILTVPAGRTPGRRLVKNTLAAMHFQCPVPRLNVAAKAEPPGFHFHAIKLPGLLAQCASKWINGKAFLYARIATPSRAARSGLKNGRSFSFHPDIDACRSMVIDCFLKNLVQLFCMRCVTALRAQRRCQQIIASGLAQCAPIQPVRSVLTQLDHILSVPAGIISDNGNKRSVFAGGCFKLSTMKAHRAITHHGNNRRRGSDDTCSDRIT